MLDPELKPFLDEWQRQWAKLPQNATPQDRRAHFEVVAAEMRLPTPGVALCRHYVASLRAVARKLVLRMSVPPPS